MKSQEARCYFLFIDQSASMKHLQNFSVSGMSCQSCVAKVKGRLLEMPSLLDAKVTLNPPVVKLTAAEVLSVESINDWLSPLGKYQVQALSPTSLPDKSTQTYRPLLILLAYLLVLSAILGWPHWQGMMRFFMGGFFLAFSFFKMLDLRGFASAYRSYDLIAKALPVYGFVYPFIELALGLSYVADVWPVETNAVKAVVMAISLVGVVKAVLSRQAIRCACLGTVFNLPMSTVTIIEDGLMVGMAVLALILPH
jgi:copper chaperone CopZ